MSYLSSMEKRKLECLFGMGSGYVLDFSNQTFADFVEEHTGLDIYNVRYEKGSGSKANRLRALWAIESNQLVGVLTGALIDYGYETNAFKKDDALYAECRSIVDRLMPNTSVPDLSALAATVSERDFETVAKQAREAIEKNQPETGLDRLHTFVIKYVRVVCEQNGITTTRDKPLHSLFGEYVKQLSNDGILESEMTSRILKSTISVLEAFNDVRNNQSLAHDNPILNRNESLLIFNHVASSIRFLRSIEQPVPQRNAASSPDRLTENDVPF